MSLISCSDKRAMGPQLVCVSLVDRKAKEIVVVPVLLAQLDVRGTVVVKDVHPQCQLSLHIVKVRDDYV